jgi:hypothetical protein
LVSGLIGICPETKTKFPTVVTGLYGPIAFGIPYGNTLLIDIFLWQNKVRIN